MDSTTEYILNKKIACRTIADETIIIGIEQGEVHLLNDTATTMWQALEKAPQSINSLVNLITSLYNVSNTVAQQDVQEFVTTLLEKDLLLQAQNI